MSENALDAQGTRLFITDLVGSPSIVPIVDTRDINFRSGSASINDTTDLDSTHREKRMGLPDEGQCSFTLMFQPKARSHALLLAARNSRAKTVFEILFTDTAPSTRYRFDGYVLALPVTAATDGILESNVVVEITGAVQAL